MHGQNHFKWELFLCFQVVGCRGTVEVNPRSLMLTEGSIIGVMLPGATKVSYIKILYALLIIMFVIENITVCWTSV